MINEVFIELVELIGVLFAVVVGFITSGIVNNCISNGEKFDVSKFIKGIVKAATACICLVIVAFVFGIIDLSSIGFAPKTAITSGIIVYTGKLVGNAMGLLGLNKNGKEGELIDIDYESTDNEQENLNIESSEIEDEEFDQFVEQHLDELSDDSEAVG